MIRNAVVLGAMVRDVIINLVGNLLLFAPLGFFVPVLYSKSRSGLKILAIGFVLSLSIELSQFALATRIADVDDVILNTLGALLGFAIFKLVYKIGIVASLVDKISQAGRKGTLKAILAYGLVTILTFLSIFFAQLVADTQTIGDITHAIASEHSQVIGVTTFDSFASLFSQARDGNKSVRTFFKVFLDRYTPFSNQDDVQSLPENTYEISGASKGSIIVYRVVAKSSQDITRIVYHGQNYPVTSFGAYHFSYATEPLTLRDHFDPFDFYDQRGEKLAISPEK
jgi:hypothetical protein